MAELEHFRWEDLGRLSLFQLFEPLRARFEEWGWKPDLLSLALGAEQGLWHLERDLRGGTPPGAAVPYWYRLARDHWALRAQRIHDGLLSQGKIDVAGKPRPGTLVPHDLFVGVSYEGDYFQVVDNIYGIDYPFQMDPDLEAARTRAIRHGWRTVALAALWGAEAALGAIPIDQGANEALALVTAQHRRQIEAFVAEVERLLPEFPRLDWNASWYRGI